MHLSIVIPAYNESNKIGRDIAEACEFLFSNEMSGEIIVFDDGSSDDTLKIAEAAKETTKCVLRVLGGGENRGKGYAVKKGIQASCGDYVMFCDSGSCVPYRDAIWGLELLSVGSCDIAHASRKLGAATILRAQPWHRRAASNFFRFVMRLVMGLPGHLTDSQCGFKVYKGDAARELYGECVSDGFLFDIEIIIRANRKGYKIQEFPIEWRCDPDSRLSMVRTPFSVIWEMFKIRRSVSGSRKDKGRV